jgi:hypothetical protein
MNSVEIESPVVEQGCCEKIRLTVSDQDFGQKVNVNVSFIMELYRVVMASFLLMFVPQKCGEELCGVFENLFTSDLNRVGLGVNVATFVSFLAMYYYEIRRENKMITYLHVNSEVPCDNDAVDEALNNLEPSKKQDILMLDKNYQRTTYIAMGGFVVNASLSSVIISKSYLDSKTATALITNILFMAVKLIDAYGIAHTDQNIFYSAYLKSRLQFNDVDPDKMIEPLDAGVLDSIVVEEIEA